jgi:hypothetical protein
MWKSKILAPPLYVISFDHRATCEGGKFKILLDSRTAHTSKRQCSHRSERLSIIDYNHYSASICNPKKSNRHRLHLDAPTTTNQTKFYYI